MKPDTMAQKGGETYVIWPRRVFNEGVNFIINNFIREIKVVE